MFFAWVDQVKTVPKILSFVAIITHGYQTILYVIHYMLQNNYLQETRSAWTEEPLKHMDLVGFEVCLPNDVPLCFETVWGHRLSVQGSWKQIQLYSVMLGNSFNLKILKITKNKMISRILRNINFMVILLLLNQDSRRLFISSTTMW